MLTNLPIGVYWQIKHINVDKEEQKDPKKFDNLISAIKDPKSVKGYSQVLWEVEIIRIYLNLLS